MDLEELILHYYLKVFSTLIIFILTIIIFFYYFTLNKKLLLKNELLIIEKGEHIDNIITNNIENITDIEIFILKTYIFFNKIVFNKFIHYGEFFIEKDTSSLFFVNTISKSSNMLNKITIVEGWSQTQLDNELSKHFKNAYKIPYEDILADTYYFKKGSDFKLFVENLKKNKKQFFLKFKNNILFEKYDTKQIITIGSLIEKEGLDIEDKQKISSVIINRLNNKMRLQIDATVIYALTDGKFNLNRKLLVKDLKINHPYNTYFIKGLPPFPISYVGKNTIKTIFENYRTDFLFYFFNKSLNKHIFSKTYLEHKKKLNEYRK